MNLEELIEPLRDQVQPIVDEAAWATLWRTRGLAEASSSTMAIHGGFLADRLAWAFLAGYQGAIRATCGTPLTGITALVASESRDDPETYPGTHLQHRNGLRLSGHKSWVAASRQVDQLIVNARHPGEQQPNAWFRVHRDQAGVTLSHRKSSRFLPAVSQGFAHFADVAIPPEQVMPTLPINRFRHTESCHVRLAIAAFLLRLGDLSGNRGTPRKDQIENRRQAADLVADLAGRCSTVSGRLDTQLTDRMDTVIESMGDLLRDTPDYASDQRLLTMYQPTDQQPAR